MPYTCFISKTPSLHHFSCLIPLIYCCISHKLHSTLLTSSCFKIASAIKVYHSLTEQFQCNLKKNPLHWKHVKYSHTTGTVHSFFKTKSYILVLTAHFWAVYRLSILFHPLVSFPHSITSAPCQSCSLTTTFIACLTTPLCAAPIFPCNICLSFGMKRKCLPVGPQVAHPEGWLRLMPVIQLCWFTRRTHRGMGDYTVLCWRRREADRQKRQRGGSKGVSGKERQMSCGRWSLVGPLLTLHLLVPDHALYYLSM